MISTASIGASMGVGFDVGAGIAMATSVAEVPAATVVDVIDVGGIGVAGVVVRSTHSQTRSLPSA
jgi:hypothetical protein